MQNVKFLFVFSGAVARLHFYPFINIGVFASTRPMSRRVSLWNVILHISNAKQRC